MNNETKRKLLECNLLSLVEVIELQDKNIKDYLHLTFDERFDLVVDELYQRIYSERIKRRIKQARLRYPEACLDTVDYSTKNISDKKLKELCTGKFIDSCTNLVITGYASSGKTNLACVIVKELCKLNIRCLYVRLPDLIQQYQEYKYIGKASSFIKKITNNKLLVIDEWLTTELKEDEVNFIFELVEKYYEHGSLIFISLFPKEQWHSRLSTDVLAESIMERTIHNAIFIDCGKKNMRELYDSLKANQYK